MIPAMSGPTPPPAPWLGPVTLADAHVVLEPLRADHAPALAVAVADGRVWETPWTTVPAPEDVPAWVDAALAQRAVEGALPFAVRALPAGDVVGSTRLFAAAPADRRLEVGHTWYAARAQRTVVNTACKRLLLGHAFDALGCLRVELRTGALNARSRRAIERLGAQLEGVLRAHRVMPDGRVRDTAVYAVTDADWPQVRARLDALLARARLA